MLCEVPIVAPELRREESVTQIADALRQLDKVANEIIGLNLAVQVLLICMVFISAIFIAV